jgi:Cu+-exporting ATPase
MKKLDDKMLPPTDDNEVGKGMDACGLGCGCSMDTHMGEQEEELEERGILGRTKLLIFLGLALTIPIVITEVFFADLAFADYALLALATPVQVLLGRPFYVRFFKSIRARRLTMDWLVVISTSIAYVYSILAIATATEPKFFEASASVLTIFTIGEYLESRVLRTTSESLRKLLELRPEKATVISQDGSEHVIDARDVAVGDTVAVKPGERAAADGVVTYGESSIDESMVTGESIPVDKKPGDRVIGGTVNTSGYLRFRAEKVGADTVLAQIIATVQKARKSRAPVQRVADRAVQYFVPIVFAIAAASSLYWLLAAQQPVGFVVTVFATVLVVSCPCALGIATPMVVSLGIDKASRHGVLIKGGEHLERLAHIDTVVFDKTGTLTKGKPELTDVISFAHNYTEDALLQLASSAESRSEHPVAQAIVAGARQRGISTLEVTDFSSVTGQGIVAVLSRTGKLFVGSPRIVEGQLSEDMKNKIEQLELEGKTVVAVVVNSQPAGAIAVADTLRDNASEIVNMIKQRGTDIVLMSGDNERTAKAVAKKVGIDRVLAPISPEAKAQGIRRLQAEGRKVAMIGDGINDAPALTQANVGIAMGSGTDIAMSSGHVILMKGDLEHFLYALDLGKYAMGKIKQNLAISFAYNAITMSIAAGVLYDFTQSLILTPGLAALGWIVSDSSVFGNSLLVRKFNSS